jgi:hypothetical protein
MEQQPTTSVNYTTQQLKTNPFEIAFEQINESFKLDTFSTETYRLWTGEGYGYGYYRLYTISERDLILKIKEFDFDTLMIEVPNLTKAVIQFETAIEISEQEWDELKKLLVDSYFYTLEPTSNYELPHDIDGHNWSLEGTNFMNEQQIREFGEVNNEHQISRQAPLKGKLEEVANFFIQRNPNRKESL